MPSTSRAPLRCSLCDATFARQEHLTRHLRTHTREKPYPCTQCSKSFSRQDVLNRHLVAHRHASRASAAVSARACLECASNRVRCSKETPCQRCQSRQLSCLYPPAQAGQSTLLQPQVDSPESVPAHVIHVAGSTPDVLAAPAPPFQQSTPRHLHGVPGVSEESLWAHSADAVAAYGSQLDTPFNAYGFAGVGLSAVNWLSPDFQHTIVWEDFAMPYQDGGIPYDPSTWETAPEPSTSIQPAPWTQQTTATTTHIPQDHTQQSPEDTEIQSSAPDHSGTSSHSPISSKTSRTTSGALYVDGSAGRAPFGGRLLHKQTCNDQAPTQAEGHDRRSPETQQKSVSPHPLVSENAHNHLRRNIAAHMPEWLSNNQNASLLEIHSIEHYVRSYFVQSHPAFPFIRKNSTSFEGENGWILLVGVAAIGAGHLDHAGHMSLSSLLDRLLDTPSAFTTQSPWHARSKYKTASGSRGSQIKLLQAGILNMILLVHTGSHQDLSRGILQRYRLSEQCNTLGLLSKLKQTTIFSPTVEATEIVSNWLMTQAEIRAGSVLYLLDSLLSTEFGCSRLFRLYDAKSPLPSLEDVWAPPPLDRITKSDLESETVTIADALEMLYMEKRLPSNLSEFSKTLLIHAVCRRVDEATYQHQESLMSWTPEARAQARNKMTGKSNLWPPSDPNLVRWRNSSCDCLDVLHWNANMISAGAGGWEHPTILHLHISRLFILTPVEDMQYVADACPRVADGLRRDADFEEAYTNIRKWALADQFKARLAIIHAGAILWHIRRYSTNSFLEPFATYLAILVVWNYSTSTIAYRRHANGNHQSRSDSGDDDALSSSPTSTDEDEDPDPTFLHIDRPCDDEIVQVYVRKGQKMEANMVRIGPICSVGAPHKILREGLRLLSGDKSWTTKEMSSFNEPVRSRFSGLWSVKWSYVRQLADLARTTESW